MMGWFNFGKETVDSTANLVEKTGNVLDELLTSDDERNAADILKNKIKQNPALWAHQLNLINASSRNWFDSGWRPGLGWVGVVSLFCFYVPQYLIASFIWAKAALEMTLVAGQNLPAYPIEDVGIMELVILLIGGAAIRQRDKENGTAK